MVRILFLLIVLLSSAAQAGSEPHFDKYFDNFPKSKEHAQKIIDHCWGISEDLRSKPDLEVIDSGHHKTAECFEDQYIKLYLIMAVENSKNKEELLQQFESLKSDYIEIMTDTAYTGSSFRPPLAHNFETNIVNTQYSFLVQDILMHLVYRVHFLNEYPGDNDEKVARAMQYLDDFTP